MTNDKPLAEKWREKEKGMVWGSNYYNGIECADQLELLVRSWNTGDEPTHADETVAQEKHRLADGWCFPNNLCGECHKRARFIAEVRAKTIRECQQQLIGKDAKP